MLTMIIAISNGHDYVGMRKETANISFISKETCFGWIVDINGYEEDGAIEALKAAFDSFLMTDNMAFWLDPDTKCAYTFILS